MEFGKANGREGMSAQYDVAIVGYGACSAVLVNLLIDCGLKVIVFDKDEHILEIPRAAHFDDETVRAFQIFGAANELAAEFTTSKTYAIYNRLNEKVWGFSDFSTTPTDQGWLSDYFFFQPALEHYLRKRAAQAKCAVKLNCEVIELNETDDHVVVTYRNDELLGRGPQTATAKFVIGADGATSFVRKAIKAEMECLAKSQRWMIVDAHVKEGGHADLSDSCWTRVGEKASITYVPMPHDIKRFELSVPEGQSDDEAGAPQAVAEFLSQWFASSNNYQVLRADVYHFHSLVAKTWRKGRIMIAGDAAHLNPPFLGQGVCAGIRDALNLGWKLASIISGKSPTALLDTYESERRPHAFAFVKIAGDVGEKIRWISTAREEELRAMAAEDYTPPRPKLGPGVYRDDSPHAGQLSPQPRLAGGSLLDDVVGYNFAVVGDPEIISAARPLAQESIDILGAVMVADNSPAVMSSLALYAGRVMVVRPDRYLVGVANTSAELSALMRNLVATVI